MGALRVAVVGHVEWAEVLRVERLPRSGGWAEASLLLHEAAGAGAVAARQLAKLAGRSMFFTRLADDELGRRAREELVSEGVDVEALFRPGGPQRRAFVHVDEAGERTITIHGEKLCPAGADPLPWDKLEGADGVYFVCGDEAALAAARQARVLVATSRWLPTLRAAGVYLDALVGSADDPSEAYSPGDLDPPPGLVVATAGADGGTFTIGNGAARPFLPAPVEGSERDAYGCGDSFAGGLTFALARGDGPEEAVAFAARCGAACFSSLGLAGQLRLAAEGC